jgi:UTP-glucose-1-phosphate uridylyltransferase
MKPTLLILAAGMGSRYGGLKQMDPVGPNHETLLDYTLYDAIQVGFGKAVFVIRPDFAESFKKDLGSRFEKKISVDYAYQEIRKTPAWFTPPAGREKPWGTGHAVLMAEGLIQEPFAMVNADDFYGRQGFESMAAYLMGARDGALADYSMVGYRLKATLSDFGTVSRGVCSIAEDGKLREVVETLRIEKTATGARDLAGGAVFSGDEIVSMNFFGFTPSIFGHLARAFDAFLKNDAQLLKGEFYVPGAVDALVKSKRASVSVLPSNDAWFGITYREDKPRVALGILDLVQAGRYPARLWD